MPELKGLKGEHRTPLVRNICTRNSYLEYPGWMLHYPVYINILSMTKDLPMGESFRGLIKLKSMGSVPDPSLIDLARSVKFN